MVQEAKPPVAKCSEYPLEVAIWENSGSEGRKYYSVSITRRYSVTDAGGTKEYKNTPQLRKQDLLLAGMLLQDAFRTIARLETQDYESRR